MILGVHDLEQDYYFIPANKFSCGRCSTADAPNEPNQVYPGPSSHPWPPAKNPKSVVIYSPGPPVTLSMAPRRIPGPQAKNPKSVVIYSPGPQVTLSMAPRRIPGPQLKTLKVL